MRFLEISKNSPEIIAIFNFFIPIKKTLPGVVILKDIQILFFKYMNQVDPLGVAELLEIKWQETKQVLPHTEFFIHSIETFESYVTAVAMFKIILFRKSSCRE